jgi:hypothetical protein
MKPKQKVVSVYQMLDDENNEPHLVTQNCFKKAMKYERHSSYAK